MFRRGCSNRAYLAKLPFLGDGRGRGAVEWALQEYARRSERVQVFPYAGRAMLAERTTRGRPGNSDPLPAAEGAVIEVAACVFECDVVGAPRG